MVPFEYQGNDEVGIHFYSPVTFFARRIRLGVVRRQDDPCGAGQVPPAGGCHGRGTMQVSERQDTTEFNKDMPYLLGD